MSEALPVAALRLAGTSILPSRLQRSLQYLTFSQSLSHFFLHVNGRLQALHIFEGNVAFEFLPIFIYANLTLAYYSRVALCRSLDCRQASDWRAEFN